MGTGTKPNPEKLFAQGVERFEEGDPAGAVKLFDRVIKADGDYLQAHYMRGVAFNALGLMPEAADAFAEVVRLEPDNADGLFNLGNAKLLLGEFAAALPLLERGYSLGVKSMDDDAALYNLGLAHFELGKETDDLVHVKRAVELFEAVERVNPFHAAAVFSRAMALFTLERFTDAEREFARVIAFDPTSAHPTVVQSHIAQSMALAALGRFEESLGALREAVHKEPRVAEVAATDPDFERLRASPMAEGFAALVGSPPRRRLTIPCDVMLSMSAVELAGLREVIYARDNGLVPSMQELTREGGSGSELMLLVFGLRDQNTATKLVELVREWAYAYHPELIKNLNWEYDRSVLAFSDFNTHAPLSLADLATLATDEPAEAPAKKLPTKKTAKKTAKKKASAKKTATKKAPAKKATAKKAAPKKKSAAAKKSAR